MSLVAYSTFDGAKIVKECTSLTDCTYVLAILLKVAVLEIIRINHLLKVATHH